jgi:hypothetical protein
MSNYNYSYFDNNVDEDYEMDNLDRMAREINDKKNKHDLVKAVHNDFLQDEKRNKRQLEEMLNNENFKYFSAQGNINNNSEDNNSTLIINNDNNTFNDSFLKSLDNYQNNIAQFKNKSKNKYKNKKEQDDNLSLLIDHLKKEHNSHIFSESESISSNSEESIIKHLKKCKKCKSKIQLVFDDNHKLKQIEEKIIHNSPSKSIVIKLSDLKEYMMVFLLIILILLVIYIFFKLK